MDSSLAPSKLHRYSVGLMEACWLTAVIVVPLIFSPQAAIGFEPFRTLYLRVFAFVLLIAWTIRMAEPLPNETSLADLWRTPIRANWTACLLIFFSSLIISTAFSVDPSQSFWGSYMRQGTLTEICCLGFLVSVAAELRSEAQIHRLVTALIVPTIPISIHAILQRAGIDSLMPSSGAGERVFGLAGNPIYLAAYLGMVFPFTVMRVMAFVHEKAVDRRLRLAALVFYILVGLFQVTAFLFTESRGPLLGLVAAVSFLAIAHAAKSNRKRLASVLAVIVLAIALLSILAIRLGPLTGLARFPVLSRLAGVLKAGVPAEEGRIDLWNQAARLLLSPEPLRYPSGEIDPLHALRPLIGFGPETLEGVLPQRFSFIGGPAPGLMTRLHNQFWDRWYSSGAIGALGFLGLVALAFGMAYQRLGFIRSRFEWGCFSIAVILSVAGLSAALIARFGPGFFGLGVMSGLTFGLVLYVVFSGFHSAGVETAPGPLDPRKALLLSALAALVFHLVETSFGFQVIDTALLFWVFLGIAIGRPARLANPEVSRGSFGPRKASSAWRFLAAGGAIAAALTTAILMCAFIRFHFARSFSIGDVLSASLTKIQPSSKPSHLLELVLVPAWLCTVFAYCLDEHEGETGRTTRFIAGVVFSGVVGGACAVAKAAGLAAIGPLPNGNSTIAAALAQGRGYEALDLGLMPMCLLLLALWGSYCGASAPAAPRWCTPRELWIGLVATLTIGIFSWFAFVNPVRANALAGWAIQLQSAGRLDAEVETLRQALSLDPHAGAYRFEMARALANLAESSVDETGFDRNMGAAETLLRAGQKITPFDKSTLNLGEIYMRWAAGEQHPGRRLILAREAEKSLHEALAYKPTAEVTLVDLAAVDQIFLNCRQSTAEMLKRADALVSARDASAWFDFFVSLSSGCHSEDLGRFYMQWAFRCCDRALEDAGRRHQSCLSLLLRRGRLHFQLGEPSLALADFQRAIIEDHDPDEWEAEALLGQVLANMGKRDSAIWHVNQAIAKAPKQMQPSLHILQAEIGAR